jgi:glycosyltransferase involved in cell wall biosynthesis
MSLPNKFFEYMAYGLPILSSCSGESEALIREERLGMQYDARDLGSFQRALAAIIDDPSERNAMSERSRALFETRFEHARLFAELEQRIGRWERR